MMDFDPFVFECFIAYNTYVSSAISETNNGIAIDVPPPANPANTLAAYRYSSLSASKTVSQNIFGNKKNWVVCVVKHALLLFVYKVRNRQNAKGHFSAE